MTDYIVDASVVIQHFITDTHTPHVDALFHELGNTVELHVPEFCLLECANVLWKEVRFHGMPQADASMLVTDLVSLPLTILPVSRLLSRSLQIGLTHQLAVYDATYIALAEALNRSLITVDTNQDKAARAVGITLKSITDF